MTQLAALGIGAGTRVKHVVKTRMRSRAQRTLCATRCIWSSWVHKAVPELVTQLAARVCALGMGAETRGKHAVKTRMRSRAQRTLCATRCIWISWVHKAVPEIATHLDARVCALGIGAETRGQHVVKTRMRSSAQRTLCATRCIWSSWVHKAVPELVTQLAARVCALGMGAETRGKHAVKTRMRSRAQRTLCATRCIWISWVHKAVPEIATHLDARVCALGIGAETRGQHVVKTRMRSSAQRTLCATKCIWSSWVHNAVPEIVTHLDARV